MRLFWTVISWSEMRRIVAADFCLELGTNWLAVLYLFYFQDLLRFTIADASALLLLIYVGVGLAGAPGLSRLTTRFGKRHTDQLTSTGFAVGLLGLAILPKGNM